MSTTVDERETQTLGYVRAYQEAVAGGDRAAAAQARGAVATLSVDAVQRATRRLFPASPSERDDIDALGLLVFFELLPGALEKFDPAKVGTRRDGSAHTFAGWVLYGYKSWERTMRRELEASWVESGLNSADQDMLRMYHGCAAGFESRHGRTWTAEEAKAFVSDYVFTTTRDRVLARRPELSGDALESAVWDRVVKDGHVRTLRELDDLLAAEKAARAVSLDAPTGSGDVLGDLLPGVVDEPDEDLGDLDGWVKVATLGMGKRETRKVVAALTGAGGEPDPALMATAQANLGDPVAQFVALGGVELQFEPAPAARPPVVGAHLEQLVLAANLR